MTKHDMLIALLRSIRAEAAAGGKVYSPDLDQAISLAEDLREETK